MTEVYFHKNNDGVVKARRIMKEFSISEISGVDQPAQGPALMTIMKVKAKGKEAGDKPGKTGLKKEDPMSKTPEELQAELKKSADDLAKATANTTRLENLASMNDAEKAHMGTLEKGKGQDDFLALPPSDRSVLMAKAAEDDPVIHTATDGTEYRKSDDPRLVKMAKRDDDRETELAKMRDDAANVHFEKRASKELAKFKGETTAKIALLKAIAGIGDETIRGQVTEMLKSAHAAAGLVLKEVGTQDDNSLTDDDADKDLAKSSENKLDTLAKAYAKEKSVDFASAYSAVLETPEGEKLYAASVA